MAATSIIIGVELGGVIMDLAYYSLSAFVIGFGLNTEKIFIEAMDLKLKKEKTQMNQKINKI